MERQLGQDIKDPFLREAFLKDNCDSCEQKGYMRSYTPEELRNKVIDNELSKIKEIAPDIAIIEV